jgi:hypothetical protein
MKLFGVFPVFFTGRRLRPTL